MDDVQRQLDENKREHIELMHELKDIKNELTEIRLSIDKLPEKFDDRYATKKLESWFYTGVGLVLSAIITAALTLVLI